VEVDSISEGIKIRNRVAVTQIKACGLSNGGKSGFGLDFSYDRTKQEYPERKLIFLFPDNQISL